MRHPPSSQISLVLLYCWYGILETQYCLCLPLSNNGLLTIQLRLFSRSHAARLVHISCDSCIMADFNRLHKGHIGTAPKSAFNKKSQENNKSDWAAYVSTQLTVWESLHRLWLTRFAGPVHVVFYEVLVRDTKDTLRNILDFLSYNVTEGDMNCALVNKEGIYRRKKRLHDFDPYTADMYQKLDKVRNKVLKMVLDYRKKHDYVLDN